MLQLPREQRPKVKPSAAAEEIIDDLLDAQQLVHAFGVTLLTIRNWTKDGGLPYVRIKGSERDTIRYRKERVIQWARKNERDLDLRKL